MKENDRRRPMRKRIFIFIDGLIMSDGEVKAYSRSLYEISTSNQRKIKIAMEFLYNAKRKKRGLLLRKP
jgi:hypothetical protein